MTESTLDRIASEIDELVCAAPGTWLDAVAATVRSAPEDISADDLISKLPPTYNSDLSHRLKEIIRHSAHQISWEALGTALHLCASMRNRWEREQKVELLWAGPAPASHASGRRIDQVLYDLIAAAQRDILLITFAAHKIQRLSKNLVAASARGIRVRLLLEFGAESQNQLSHDAVKAFPADLQRNVEIFYWPIANREINHYGKPGKLHAKAAVIDDQALLSSANLTDDAFLRNLELGVLFTGGTMPTQLRDYFDHLIANKTLVRWRPNTAVSAIAKLE
jgi:cardiolipin synthase